MRETLRLIIESKRGLIGLSIIVIYALMAIIGPIIVPYDSSWHFEQKYQPPSLFPFRPFGTDYAGRDIFAQIVHGSRSVLTVAMIAAAIIVSVGSLLGILAGISGGIVDSTLVFIVDIALTIPTFPILLLLVTVFETQDPFSFAAMLSITGWADLARSVRAQVLSLKEREFVEAARALGLGKFHIIFREILPNIMNYIAISFMFNTTGAIYTSVGLFFVGIATFDVTNWGVILNSGMQRGLLLPQSRLMIFAPVLVLTILQTGLVLFAGGLEEVFNPRLRED